MRLFLCVQTRVCVNLEIRTPCKSAVPNGGCGAVPGDPVVKNLPANAGDTQGRSKRLIHAYIESASKVLPTLYF